MCLVAARKDAHLHHLPILQDSLTRLNTRLRNGVQTVRSGASDIITLDYAELPPLSSP